MKHTIFILTILTFLSFTACKTKEKEAVKETVKKQFCLSDTMLTMVQIDSVKMCRIDDEITLSGEVNFDENKVNKIFPRSSGQVIESKVTLGDKVTQGQVLAVIRSADIAGSYADITSANADIAITKRQVENTENLFKNGIASERELNEAKQNYEKAKAVKNKIEVQLNINGGNNTKAGGIYMLTSPINGYVVEKKINAGNFIRSDANDNVFTISDLKDVWVIANVFEADIPRVQQGMTVQVTTLAYPDKIMKGTIEKSSSVLDPINKVMKVRIRLDNTGLLLKPEMFTKVVVTNQTEGSAICLPKTAIIEENGKTFVVLFNSNCNLKVQEVNIIKEVGSKIYISNGLAVGQKILTKGALLVYDEFTDNQ